mmetsp:Transcript_102062/g.304592  ORF Transcript_102062/g.304592 Transcript_102062/m.304592 type:complete len:281 (-) Transcript_102062:126-968(-)
MVSLSVATLSLNLRLWPFLPRICQSFRGSRSFSPSSTCGLSLNSSLRMRISSQPCAVTLFLWRRISASTSGSSASAASPGPATSACSAAACAGAVVVVVVVAGLAVRALIAACASAVARACIADVLATGARGAAVPNVALGVTCLSFGTGATPGCPPRSPCLCDASGAFRTGSWRSPPWLYEAFGAWTSVGEKLLTLARQDARTAAAAGGPPSLALGGTIAGSLGLWCRSSARGLGRASGVVPGTSSPTGSGASDSDVTGAGLKGFPSLGFGPKAFVAAA